MFSVYCWHTEIQLIFFKKLVLYPRSLKALATLWNTISSNNLTVDSLALSVLTITSSGKENNFQSFELLQLKVPNVYPLSWPGSAGAQEAIS